MSILPLRASSEDALKSRAVEWNLFLSAFQVALRERGCKEQASRVATLAMRLHSASLQTIQESQSQYFAAIEKEIFPILREKLPVSGIRELGTTTNQPFLFIPEANFILQLPSFMLNLSHLFKIFQKELASMAEHTLWADTMKALAQKADQSLALQNGEELAACFIELRNSFIFILNNLSLQELGRLGLKIPPLPPIPPFQQILDILHLSEKLSTSPLSFKGYIRCQISQVFSSLGCFPRAYDIFFKVTTDASFNTTETIVEETLQKCRPLFLQKGESWVQKQIQHIQNRQIKDLFLRQAALAFLDIGSMNTAIYLTQQIANHPMRSCLLQRFSQIALALPSPNWALEIIETIPTEETKIKTVRDLAKSLAKTGNPRDLETAMQIISQTIHDTPMRFNLFVEFIEHIPEESQKIKIVRDLVNPLPKTGNPRDLKTAMQLIFKTVRNEFMWFNLLAELIEAIPDEETKIKTVCDLAKPLAKRGDPRDLEIAGQIICKTVRNESVQRNLLREIHSLYRPVIIYRSVINNEATSQNGSS